MLITLDTSDLSGSDIILLRSLIARGPSAQTEPDAPVHPALPEAPPTSSKPVAAPKAQPKAEKPPAAASEAESVLDGGAPSVKDALAAASALIGKGEQAKVKAALDLVGGAKVGSLTEDQVPEFLSALED